MRRSSSRVSHAVQTAGIIFINMALIAAIIIVSINIYRLVTEPPAVTALRSLAVPDWIEVDLIKIDGASRRGTTLDDLGAIVVHYVGNPGTTAQNNRNYFNNPDSTVSAHFVVGLDGEIIQCIPLHEKSSASNHRNSDTISIEVCHPNETGVFTDAAYDALVRLTAWLCVACDLDADQIIRHYDVTGKSCPKWFVDDETAWAAFKTDVMTAKE
ncbi:MAG: N-acetylmuramoyl-L-alanine amidase [Clostridia bacterium]|nr:N-acetylmuramoyl-L-alanine amidase [Clostridia bacterium]